MTPRPTSGEGYLAQVEDWCRGAGVGRVASVVGRYWAMDRDRRWERTQDAYDLLVHGRAEHHRRTGRRPRAPPTSAARPTSSSGRPRSGRRAGSARSDSVLCFNFRPDRMREIVRALAEPGFGEGTEDLPGWRGRGGRAPIRRLATMTEYQQGWPYPVAFTAAHPATTLGAVIEAAGERQLHVAETEKYAHVTYFFNGGRERPYAGERRALVPSQRDVPTYDQKPQMSAREITDAFLRSVRRGPAPVLDHQLRQRRHGRPHRSGPRRDQRRGNDRRVPRAGGPGGARAGGVCVITADHGNAEHMLEDDGSPNTAHSSTGCR